MFKKILIANRGEIACRVIKSAQRMGIKTVAVYSDADQDALHVKMADEAVHLGPPAAAESYLLGDKIIQACKDTGAEAVHPGYGFLSENADFCKALAEAGIEFIGPPTGAIKAMGDKIESKKFANEAEVSTVPGHMDVIEDAEHAVRIARDVGFPVMIKASAGGGGKGMRIAWDEDEAREGFQLAKSEAKSSFGDDRCFIEKFVVGPRHIEIQVLADKHGNAVYLGERECSIQRRNQKVIEEAPSPFLDEKTRKAMGEQAVALAKAVDYCSAGTVEFIVDKDKNFYFLEMNTRLQVEHPVTELITGVDLVEQMIRVAYGEKLEIAQDDVKLNGWAIESRIYAEDPFRNFLPSIGRLVNYMPPQEGTVDGLTIRNDTGVVSGSEISMFYDPMIAKLCTHANSREAAIAHMSTALDAFVVDGIEHNVPFLAALMDHPRWKAGNLTTAFIDEEYPDGFEGVSLNEESEKALAAVALSMELVRKNRLDDFIDRMAPHSGETRQEWVVALSKENRVAVNFVAGMPSTPIEMDMRYEDGSKVAVVSDWVPGANLWTGTVGGKKLTVQVRAGLNSYQLTHSGVQVDAKVMRPNVAAMEALMPVRIPPDTSNLLLCPMPGLVVSIAVQEGQQVQAGEALATVEAMKMENILRAERDLVVSKINAVPGDSLAVDAVIMEFASGDDA
ncbi:acetyl-CoA carboxylase biotin carboxylase subunit [Cohaesibacter gelatinilyticus]|uniref:propionyl-CoA carboxylase n=1 Tax=Cohaesibacter gelatinilyticus TaxID=372072 RepID=A0A285NKZ0_9HYPH|nr:acetyl/propionyl/methylcrotonyl-CoA carboxylase subunit alpha [Cohaesibacter gelatinilyticus]SNZ08321.1 biotin carboxyl carrier protein /biotin carboxylase [Cohaesibacter gelatinilyticus]